MMTYEEAYKRLKRRLYEGKDGDHEDIYIAMKAIETVEDRKKRLFLICIVTAVVSTLFSAAVNILFVFLFGGL